MRALLCAVVLAEAASGMAAQEAGSEPVRAEGGIAVVTADALRPLLAQGQAFVPVRFQDVADLPVRPPVLSAEMTGPGTALLRRLYARGRAAGHFGDLYDNRDRDHSSLPRGAFPQLSYVSYGPVLRSRQVDYGAAGALIFGAPVLGNSSTALTAGPFWRSQPRFLLTQNGGAARLFSGYAAGQIYVYPEHRDHDPDLGDLMPANTPYYLISQGSSGSDRPHLHALAMILAAFQPQTKARLMEEGLLAPAVQMVYRRARTPIRSRAAYLSGLAHPTVFGPKEINLDRMVSLANAIAPDEIPPLVRLQVLEEDLGAQGVDFFGEGLSEVLFDTPSAVARIWRSRAARRQMLVSVEGTSDPNGRALSFDWALLRGDPRRVRIEPLEGGTRARITLDWQRPRPVPGTGPGTAPGTPEIISPRIDIGVFANNGAHDSAPAILSVLLPVHEARVYAPVPGAAPRPISIDYRQDPERYADPLLFPQIDWRDVFPADASGGWVREHTEGRTERFDALGAGPLGRPLYRVEAGPDDVPRIVTTVRD